MTPQDSPTSYAYIYFTDHNNAQNTHYRRTAYESNTKHSRVFSYPEGSSPSLQSTAGMQEIYATSRSRYLCGTPAGRVRHRIEGATQYRGSQRVFSYVEVSSPFSQSTAEMQEIYAARFQRNAYGTRLNRPQKSNLVKLYRGPS